MTRHAPILGSMQQAMLFKTLIDTVARQLSSFKVIALPFHQQKRQLNNN
jgi:hypothetical protein